MINHERTNEPDNKAICELHNYYLLFFVIYIHDVVKVSNPYVKPSVKQ